MSIFRLLKNYIKLNWIYPQKDKFKRIKTVIPNSIKLGLGIIVEENVTFSNEVKEIGNYVFIGKNTQISNCEVVAPFCSISQNVRIGLEPHPKHLISTSPAFYKKSRGLFTTDSFKLTRNLNVIEADVLISSNVLINNGVKLGVGCIVGAGAFVNKDVPPYAIVVGIPAKIIGYRFEKEIIEKLLASKWWEREPNALARLQEYVSNPLEFIEKLER